MFAAALGTSFDWLDFGTDSREGGGALRQILMGVCGRLKKIQGMLRDIFLGLQRHLGGLPRDLSAWLGTFFLASIDTEDFFSREQKLPFYSPSVFLSLFIHLQYRVYNLYIINSSKRTQYMKRKYFMQIYGILQRVAEINSVSCQKISNLKNFSYFAANFFNSLKPRDVYRRKNFT